MGPKYSGVPFPVCGVNSSLPAAISHGWVEAASPDYTTTEPLPSEARVM